MAAALPQSDVAVVDDLQSTAKPGDGEQFVDLNVDDSQSQQSQQTQSQQQQPVQQQQQQSQDDDDADIPAELRGKSPKELARMYREAQTLIGRQGSELGELRRTADIAIRIAGNRGQGQAPAAQQPQSQQPAQQGQQQAPVDESQFFAKPADTVAKMIENHPIIKKINETLGAAERDRAIQRATDNTNRFNAAHPDAGQILQDPEFRQWVNASRVRAALLRQAHERFDFDAGDELFGTWKALKGTKAAGQQQQQGQGQQAGDVSAAARTLANQRKQKLQDAATPTGGNASPQQGAQSKKIYRRADVLKLMEEQPARYEQMADEIALAYAEGRVR